MTYALSGSISPRAFKNNPAQLVTITATSIVPVSGTCVTFIDIATGGQAPLVYNSATSQWEAQYQIPSSTTDGTYNWTLRATDCISETVLSNIYASTYIVDTIGPLIVPQSLTPQAGGNTVFASQPLLAKLIDRRAGVDVATINFELRDETTGTNTQHSAQSWSASSWWAKTAPVSLMAGHLYTLGVSVRDNAGNEAVYSQDRQSSTRGFLATSFSSTTADASVPHSVCNLSDIQLDGMKTVTCTNVPLEIGTSVSTLSGTKSWAEKGYVVHTASLASATIRSSTLNQSVPVFTAGTTRAVTLPFDVSQADYSSQSFAVAGTTINLGTISKKVPATFTDAWIEMLGTPAVQTSTAPQACVDPSLTAYGVRAPHCTPDPVGSRYMAIFKVGTSAPAADSLAQSVGLTAVRGEDKGIVEGSVSAAQALFNQTASVASVQHMGGHDVVDAWGELQGDLCVTRSLRTVGGGTPDAGPVGFTGDFSDLQDGSCGLQVQTVESWPVVIPPLPPRPTPCEGAGHLVWSGDDTVNDPINWPELSWLRGHHRVEWSQDCLLAKWTPGAQHARSGSNQYTCWWYNYRPRTNAAYWNQDRIVDMDYEADFKSREYPNWAGGCTPPWIPPRYAGMDCDVNIWVSVFGKANSITSSSLFTSTPWPGGRGGACSWLHDSDDEAAGDNSLWRGNTWDKCIAITSTGDVAEDDTNWCI